MKKRFFKHIIPFILVFSLVSPLKLAQASRDSHRQDDYKLTKYMLQDDQESPELKARKLLDSMTPAERVGQLFLVTFQGTDIGPETSIYKLINNYHVGGVVLFRDNDNFSDGNKTIENTISLTRQLQTVAWEASQATITDTLTNELYKPQFIPLFMGISQEGDGYPYDQILNGLTELPNEMAIGATWNPDLARQTGVILGQELSSLGINFLLGPSLDVLESPNPGNTKDLGTRTFGGDPYWVGLMGQAFIQGVHSGSQGKVAVISKHFPGHGGSDRLPEEEVATVRKSLDQLIGFELSPFLQVTGNSPFPEATTDGLLTAHIRYQGFQGNIRATTRPVSFDQQAMKLLMELPQLSAWRNDGGILVTDNLGSRAVRGFYDLTNQTFDMPRRVALNAFLAGNDLLYVADFSSGDMDNITSAIKTLEFFSQKYREDPAFAQRVDESVLRILTLKYRLFKNFELEQIQAAPNKTVTSEDSNSISFQVAQKAATLISPLQAELDDTLPDPPNPNDRIVFLTDVRTAKQCSQCSETPLVGREDLEDVVVRLYGPSAGGQVTPTNLSSFSLDELEQMLDADKGNYTLERALNRATWIVFLMLNNSNTVPSYDTLSRFLVERPDLFQRKHLIVFALNAPYYLDATNVSKLTAFYGLYSKSPTFVDLAAYLLFHELRAESASPVSIPGVGYDLSVALFPNPDQIIPIEPDVPGIDSSQVITSSSQIPTYQIGDIVSVRTGVIMDSNGNPVPDRTPVEFWYQYLGEADKVTHVDFTVNGVARTSFNITSAGEAQIGAQSESATSEIFQINIPAPAGDATPFPTETFTPFPTETPLPTISPTAENQNLPAVPPGPAVGDWIMATLIVIGAAWLTYRFTASMGLARWGVRAAFLVAIFGLAAYIYIALGLPGSEKVIESSVSRGIFLATLIGAGIGVLVAWIWRLLSPKRISNL